NPRVPAGALAACRRLLGHVLIELRRAAIDLLLRTHVEILPLVVDCIGIPVVANRQMAHDVACREQVDLRPALYCLHKIEVSPAVSFSSPSSEPSAISILARNPLYRQSSGARRTASAKYLRESTMWSVIVADRVSRRACSLRRQMCKNPMWAAVSASRGFSM